MIEVNNSREIFYRRRMLFYLSIYEREIIAAIPQLAELNIGHYLIGEAVFGGLENAVRKMRGLMDDAR